MVISSQIRTSVISKLLKEVLKTPVILQFTQHPGEVEIRYRHILGISGDVDDLEIKIKCTNSEPRILLEYDYKANWCGDRNILR